MAYRVLLVEDDESARRSFERLLGALGHEVEACATFKEGQRAFLAKQPDVVLTDTVLLDPNFPTTTFYGFELAQYFRYKKFHGPIIGMSGGDPDEAPPGRPGGRTVREWYTHAGADSFLQKPFGLSDLEQAIEQAMEVRKQGRAAETPKG